MTAKKIEIISYVNGLEDKIRLAITTELINNSKSDILLFPGHTLEFVNEIDALKKLITNKKAEAIIELRDINSDKIGNCLYRISKGQVSSLYTNQIVVTSREVDDNYELVNRLIHEFEANRLLTIKGFKTLIIQCGEFNILRNIQSENNRVDFRLVDEPELKERFEKLIAKVDIFFNPIHTPMGNQGKMKKRREYLSKNNKYYFSTSNTKVDHNDLTLKSLQYSYYNGSLIDEINIKQTDNYISRIYEID